MLTTKHFTQESKSVAQLPAPTLANFNNSAGNLGPKNIIMGFGAARAKQPLPDFPPRQKTKQEKTKTIRFLI